MTNERGTYSDSFGILLTWELQVEAFEMQEQTNSKYARYIEAYWYCYKDMDGANQVGIQGILFTGSNNLKEQLFQLSIL